MAKFSEEQFESFVSAKLQSERVRSLCTLLFFALFMLLGVFRIVNPVGGEPSVGWVVLGISFAYVIYEWLVVRLIRNGIEQRKDLSQLQWRLHSVAECLYPIVCIVAVRFSSEINPFTLLVSPAYPFIIVLIAVAILHLNRNLTILTGIAGTLGYLFAVLLFFATKTETEINPHPVGMYGMLTMMLAVATMVSAFVTDRIRNYVALAVAEMDARRQRDQMERDLELAREIQQSLLPEKTPTLVGYDIAAHSEPADQTGGDYYDWQLINDTRIIVSLADVTGHGVGPALVTAACRAYVRSTVSADVSPHDVIEKVNGLLNEDMPAGKFVTFAMIDLDTASHQAVLLAAGHGPTLLVRAKTGEIDSVSAQGLPMGISSDHMFDQAISFEFEPGDLIVLFTDGFFEWANEDGKQFGLDRLRAVVTENREQSAAEIISEMDKAIRKFIGNRRQDDDMTAVVIRRLP